MFSSVMEWTNDKVIQLIDMYRDRPVLWDCRLKDFRDRSKRIGALLEIVVRFGVEKDEIERKIKNLVCHFSRELKREREGIKSGASSDDAYKSKWFCYDSMLFLKNRNRPRRMTDSHNQGQKLTEDVDVTEEETQNVEQTEEPSEKKRKRLLKLTSNEHPSSQKTHQSKATETLPVMKDIQGHRALKDQYTAFGEHVGMRIRDISSPYAKTIVKHLISNILFEAELGKYNNPNSFLLPHLQPTHNVPHLTMSSFSYPTVPESVASPSPFSQHAWYSSKMTTSHQNQPTIRSPTNSSQDCTDSESIDSILKEI